MFGWFKKKNIDKNNSSSKKGKEPEGEKDGSFKRLKEKLAKTRDSFIHRLDSIFSGKKAIDPELLEDLEEILITADLGLNITGELIGNARKLLNRNELRDPLILRNNIRADILNYLIVAQHSRAAEESSDQRPLIIMVVGVNGVGKTTTIGKLSHRFVREGKKVMLVAADTFRAAAADQLKVWGARNKVEVRVPDQKTDPSAVVYEALDYASSEDFDVIIIDTAGRLHTKVNLMEELKKIKKITDKKIPGAPHEIFLVLDATTGQNAISQTRLFDEAVGITGLILTKLDGTAKGGIVINICNEFNIPVRFIGIGEKMEDLREFDPQQFVEALFSDAA